MGRLAVKMDAQVRFGIGDVVDHRVAGGMQQHAHIHVLEGALFLHDDLAAAAFFRRATENGHLAAQIADHFTDGRAGAHGDGAHHVVAAGVAHALHSVELAENTDVRAGLSAVVDRFDGGLQAADAGLHRKAVFLQQSAHGLAGKILFEIIFGVVPQVVRQLGKLRQDLVHPAAGPLFIILHILSPVTSSSWDPARRGYRRPAG